MLIKSARTVSCELYWETHVYIGLTSWLAEGVATILCCCAKLVFMLLTIGLWRGAGLLKLWIAASNGAVKCSFWISKPIDLTNRYNNFCKIYKKIENGPAVNLFRLHFYF